MSMLMGYSVHGLVVHVYNDLVYFSLCQLVRHWGLSDVHAYGVPSVHGLVVTCL